MSAGVPQWLNVPHISNESGAFRDLEIVIRPEDQGLFRGRRDTLSPGGSLIIQLRPLSKDPPSSPMATQSPSSAALAILRRRRSFRLADTFRKLKQYREREDYHSYTLPVFVAVRELHDELGQGERSEGNTLMVLRNVRNCMIGRNANDLLRDPEKLEAIASIFDNLSKLDTVDYSYTRKVFRSLFEAGLRPDFNIELVDSDDEAE